MDVSLTLTDGGHYQCGASTPLVKEASIPSPIESCGIWVVDLQRGAAVEFMAFETGCDEVFAVEVMPGMRWLAISDYFVAPWDYTLGLHTKLNRAKGRGGNDSPYN